LGFPTANIPIGPAFSIPSEGIYATVAIIDGQRWASVTNIGTAPTFNRTDSLIEVHILDFDQPLYGKYLQVEFVERIRSELTFPSESALKNQIAKDIKKAKIILKKNTEDKS
jgi:riboflavin kinase/FMN adenylyltransferase